VLLYLKVNLFISYYHKTILYVFLEKIFYVM